jgi:hypothetical protein
MIGDGDLEAIFASGDFDEDAVFTISPNSDLTVRGWFTDGSEGSIFPGVEIEAAKPSLICKTDDITDVRPRMVVNIRSTDYRVEKIERVGTGVSAVYLKT